MAKPRYLPYGYRIQNGLITPDTAQAEYVRQIYQLYLAGNSLQEIAKRLQATGIPYSDETGWNKNTVHRIVKKSSIHRKGQLSAHCRRSVISKSASPMPTKSPHLHRILKGYSR